jgi:hypothetical protein
MGVHAIFLLALLATSAWLGYLAWVTDDEP